MLTRRAVDTAALRDVGHQADLVAGEPGREPHRRRRSRTCASSRRTSPSSTRRVAERRSIRCRSPARDHAAAGQARRRHGHASTARTCSIAARRRRADEAVRPHAAEERHDRALDAVRRQPADRCARRRSRSPRSSRSCSRAGSRRPVRRVADASRSLARGDPPEPVPVEGADRARARSRPPFNDLAAQLAPRPRGGAELPALGEPRAEDAADGDPRLRGGARGRRRRAARGSARSSRRRPHGSSGSCSDLLDLARMNRTRLQRPPRARSTSPEVAEEAVRRYEQQARRLRRRR